MQNQGGYKLDKRDSVAMENLKAQVSKLEGQMGDLKISSKNVKSQLSQLINMMSQRLLGALPSHPKPNPRESVNVIMLRSGEGYDGFTMLELVIDEVVTENHQASIKEKEVPIEEGPKKKVREVQAKLMASKVPVELYKPKISFPQRLKQNRSDP